MTIVYIILAIGLIIAIVSIANVMNKKHIKKSIEGKGGKVLSIKLELLPKGGLFERNETYYTVKFINSKGKQIEAMCKTSMSTGVFWSDDSVDF